MGRRYKENKNFRLAANILLLFLISRLIMVLVWGIFDLALHRTDTFSFAMNEWDAKRYWFMVENGYTFPWDFNPQANWAFFPGYMLVCMGVKALTFFKLDTYWCGMLVSNTCIVLAAFWAVKYLGLTGAASGTQAGTGSGAAPGTQAAGGRADSLRVEDISLIHKEGGRWHVDFWHNNLLIAFLMMFAPYTFYFASMYTESMFVFMIVLTLYFSKKRNFTAAGIAAMVASSTRIVGCLLVFPIIFELFLFLQEEGAVESGRFTLRRGATFVIEMLKRPGKMINVLMAPMGTFAYMEFLYFFCGDAWAFKNVQIAWREDHYFPVIGVMFKAVTNQIEDRYTYMGWFCVAMFVVYFYMWKKRRITESFFGILSLLVPLTSHVMSTCRFTVGSFVIFLGFTDLFLEGYKKHKKLAFCGLFVLFALEIFLLFNWYNSDAWLM